MGAQMTKYIGGGDWFPGVPARDLSAEETALHAAFLATPTGRRLYESDGTAALALTDVAGIGEKTAAALVTAGIATAQMLVMLDAEAIDARLDGVLDYVTVEKVRTWQAAAAALLAPTGKEEK